MRRTIKISGGTGWSKLSRDTEFSGANGDRKRTVLPVQQTTRRIGNVTHLNNSLLCYVVRCCCFRASTLPSNIRGCQFGTVRSLLDRVWRMNRLTRDGTVKPVSRDEIIRRARTGTGKKQFSLFSRPREGFSCLRTCKICLNFFGVLVSSRRYFQHAHFMPIVSVEKRGKY